MTVPAIEPMSAEEREYRGQLVITAITLCPGKEPVITVGRRKDFNSQRRWTALECRLMAASNALRRVA